MNVLSLFDGMSCGQQALNRAGIHYDNYYASEIDKHAIIVTQANYPNTIQLGDVRNINIDELPTIDLLIGGSPCQSFSFAGKRKGMSTKDEKEILTLEHYLQLKEEQYEFEGQSYLFWEFMRVLNTIKPKYFLLENVMMGEKWEKVLSKAIGVRPIEINSLLVSAQNRRRLYWTNIGLEPAGLFGDLESSIKQPKDKGLLLKNVLEQDVDDKYYLSEKMISWLLKHSDKTGNEIHTTDGSRKSKCLCSSALKNVNLDADFIVHSTFGRTSKNGNGRNGDLFKTDNKSYALDTQNCQAIEILHQSKIRRLTPVECERLQTVEDNYTNHVSNSQRYKMLGNGWTIDVIAHIFNYIK
jgi:DNA (cytosine-5)-methyltransferase 3A